MKEWLVARQSNRTNRQLTTALDKSIRDKMVLDNVNLVWFVLKQLGLYNQADYYYDLGLIGLVRAANNYDSDKNIKFNTYAVTAIRNEILRDIRHNSMCGRNEVNNALSLDMAVNTNSGDNEEITLMDLVASDFNLEEFMIHKERIELLRKAILTLDNKEKRLLLLYLNEIPQKNIAKIMGIAQPTVSRNLKKLIEKLRKEVNNV